MTIPGNCVSVQVYHLDWILTPGRQQRLHYRFIVQWTSTSVHSHFCDQYRREVKI